MLEEFISTETIESIDDLYKRDIKPEDLKIKFIDPNGQEFCLRYDQENRVIKIVKLTEIDEDEYANEIVQPSMEIPQVEPYKQEMSGSFNPSPPVSPDAVKTPDKGMVLNKLVTDKEDDIKEINTSESVAPETLKDQEKPAKDVKKQLKSPENALELLKIMEERLISAEKNLFESKVFDPRYSYDNKILYDEISRAVKSEMSQTISDLILAYDDLVNGREDINLKKKNLPENIKKILDSFQDRDTKLKFLREYEYTIKFQKTLQILIDTLKEVRFKITQVSSDVLGAHSYLERNKYQDAITTFNTCNEDLHRTKIFFDNKYEILIT